jgi:vacuolar-type H+-ATPase subunit E/Vma4
MLKKVITKFNDAKEERARIAREKAEEEARKERERIQAEKDDLMALSEKELMVEAIMALRGYNTHLNNMVEKLDNLENRVNSIDSNVSSMRWSIDELKNK